MDQSLSNLLDITCPATAVEQDLSYKTGQKTGLKPYVTQDMPYDTRRKDMSYSSRCGLPY